MIHKSDYICAQAADADELWQPGAGNNLQAWARKTHTHMADRIYDLPSGLNHTILEGGGGTGMPRRMVPSVATLGRRHGPS